MSSDSPCCCSVRPPEKLATSVTNEGWGWLIGYLPFASLLLSGIFLLPGFLVHLFGHSGHSHGVESFGSWMTLLLNPAWVAVLLCGVPMLFEGVHDLFRFRMSVAVLVAAAIIATISIGDPFAAGEIAFIMTLGEMLERWTVRRARRGIEKLVQLTPRTARRLVPGGEDVMIPASEIRSGERLRVLPGETIPVDGVVESGNSSIDQQLISGEPIPVDKGPGDELFCGTVNRFGTLVMQATGVGEDSSLARMIRLVREAEAARAPMERIANRWASILVPTAMLTALAVALATGDTVRGVTILVVFCPCALVLATPTAIVAAIGNAARYGIIIRSGEALERLGMINVVAFDKTGTLTEGRPQLATVHAWDSRYDEQQLLEQAATLATQSDHPLSQCVAEAARKRSLTITQAENCRLIPGRGVVGRTQDRTLLLGNIALLHENGLEGNERVQQAQERLHPENTVLWCAEIEPQCRLLGLFELTDTVRPNAAETIALTSAEYARALLLTGDHTQPARQVAEQIGIAATDIYAERTPEGKLAVIEQLQREGGHVAMVGDGINDAPALKRSDVGIAMGKAGSDLAIEAADVTLIGDDISRVPFLIHLSRKTRATIIGNIVFSIFFNIAAVILAASGLIGPAVGALLHNGSSLVVILNASFLLSVRRQNRPSVQSLSSEKSGSFSQPAL